MVSCSAAQGGEKIGLKWEINNHLFLLILLFLVALSRVSFADMAAGESSIFFDIPPQRADEALTVFGQQADITVLYQYEIVKEHKTNPLRGAYTLADGIARLLDNTGLGFAMDSAGHLIITQGDKLEKVETMDTRRQSLLAAAIGFLMGTGGIQQAAAENGVSNSSGGQSVTLEEIVVTAQKREESAQDVPIALTALSGTSLANSGIASHEDLTLVTPGLQYVRAVGSATPFIRGVGNTNTAPGTEGSVATYIDGFYVRDMNNASQNFNGVERVEVLKGPQGTLFGRNATGGIIQTITKTPSHESEAIVGLHLGNNDVFGGDFYGTTALSETLAADLMIAAQRQNGGSGTNLTTGADVGYDEYSQIRSKWLWSATEATDVTLTMNWSEKDNDIGMLRVCAEGGICLAGLPHPDNYRDTYSNVEQTTESEGYLLGLKVQHSLENVDLVSLTSYQNYKSTDVIDQDGGPASLINVILDVETKTFSQEFQLLSTYESPLQWIVGAFYWDDKPATSPGNIFGQAVSAAVDFQSNLDTVSYALFGQGYYNFTDNTKLTLGLRWTKDEKDIYGRSVLGPFASNPSLPSVTVPFRDNESWDELTWRVALDHQLRDDLMVYASYNRGFLAGTFNAFVVSGVLQPPLEPEILDTYAVGMKGDFLDSRLRVNAELFYNESQNMQLIRVDGASTVLFNAAEGESTGLEISTTALLTDNLTVQLNYAYLDAEYKSFPVCDVTVPSATANRGLGGNLLVRSDCSGNPMIQSPEHTLGVVLEHSLPTSVGIFDTSVTYFYNDGYYVAPDKRHRQPSYSVVNGSVAWLSNDERYKVSLYGNNLTEEEYTSYKQSSSIGDLEAVGIYPREYGVRFIMTIN